MSKDSKRNEAERYTHLFLHMSASGYLDVLKASYDYEPQSEDEIAIKEDQILILLEKTDDE